MELTPRQADVITVIRNYKHLHGHTPTIRELCASLSLGRATVMFHVKACVRKGFLNHTPRKARTLEVTADLLRRQEPPKQKQSA